MKRTTEKKISIALAIVALVLYAVAIVTGLVLNLQGSIDKICSLLGTAMTCMSLAFLSKANTNTAEQ